MRPRWIKPKQACEILGISRSTLQRMIHSDPFPFEIKRPTPSGHMILLRLDQVEEYNSNRIAFNSSQEAALTIRSRAAAPRTAPAVGRA